MSGVYYTEHSLCTRNCHRHCIQSCFSGNMGFWEVRDNHVSNTGCVSHLLLPFSFAYNLEDFKVHKKFGSHILCFFSYFQNVCGMLCCSSRNFCAFCTSQR
ncbi:hypothetical protein PHAVU_002G220800 [Phaseolus vulgaris]|uniref:Uncharacterized protein n=1 Tax=Phaseolus vulgaris TaxID=3885 RepID=V7CQN2_PHAVU|nr:hypothetical protein PHAVU_002G220800g [Phaseolus vulgaris]ESW31231.1 hypothetical protein PHAVU_002G220800g [Phaseolus vulgaris]